MEELSLRDFTKEDIPRVIAKWLYGMVEKDEEWNSNYIEDRFYGANSVRDVITDIANDIASGRWMRDLVYETEDIVRNEQ